MRLIRHVAFALATVLSAVPALAASGKIVLYTSQPDKDAQDTVKGFQKANPGVEVEIFRSGTTEIMAKLSAEFAGGQPRADVLLIADAVSMEALKKDSRLLKYDAAKTEGFRDGAIDPEKFYFGSKLITTGIAVHTDAKAKPTSWADLARPEYRGLIAMPSPLYSGAAAIMLGAIVERPDLGWKYYEALAGNQAAAVRGNGAVLKSVASGEKPVGVLVDFMALNAKQKGSPVEFVVPAEGLPAVTEPVAILSSTGNADAAKAFVDFILSEEGQKLAVSQGYIPARAGVAGPSWLPEGAQIKLMPMDLKSILQRAEADRKRFADLFGG